LKVQWEKTYCGMGKKGRGTRSRGFNLLTVGGGGSKSRELILDSRESLRSAVPLRKLLIGREKDKRTDRSRQYPISQKQREEK